MVTIKIVLEQGTTGRRAVRLLQEHVPKMVKWELRLTLVTQFPLHCGHAKTCLTFEMPYVGSSYCPGELQSSRLTASLAPRDVPRGRPPGISQKSTISYRLFTLDKSRLLPTNLDPLNTMLPMEKLSGLARRGSIVEIEVLCVRVKVRYPNSHIRKKYQILVPMRGELMCI
eukprot:sb/3479402/